tara:strand:- start:24 stop:278 length:255 start_codon:yes stop_codon:yes gene_type:complete
MSDINFEEQEKEFYKKLGIALRNARRAAYKTQTDVGQSINVTFQQIQKYEKATNYPKEFRTRKMVEYLGRDYETFLKENNVHTN